MRTQAQLITNLSNMILMYPEHRTLFQLELKDMDADFDDIYPDFTWDWDTPADLLFSPEAGDCFPF